MLLTYILWFSSSDETTCYSLNNCFDFNFGSATFYRSVVIMKSTTKRPARERKHQDGVANQLSRIASKKTAEPTATKAVSKAKRVFKKAGCPDPTDADVKTYLIKLAEIGQKSSRPIAKAIRDGGKK